MQVCWHRCLSYSALDAHRTLLNQLSGYLLRKFKKSNGWQKLWVVYTSYNLFFFKTHQVKNTHIAHDFSGHISSNGNN